MASRPGNPNLATDIIRATADIVEERGPEGVTMRAVADRIGYSPTTIYLYFENKEDLLKQALIRAYEWLMAAVQDAGGTPRARLMARSESYVRWAINHPGLYRFMYESPVLQPADETEMNTWIRGWEITREILESCVADGSLAPQGDLATSTTAIWAAVHGIVMLAISGRLARPGDDLTLAEIEARALALTGAFVCMCFAEPRPS